MKKYFFRISVIGVLFFALSFGTIQAKTITMDGEFDDWDDVSSLLDDTIAGYPYSGTIYHFDNNTNSWVVGSDGNACMYTANRALDLGELKLTNDDNYLYILWKRGSDFLNYYWIRGDATEEYQFSNTAAPDVNGNPCAGEIVTAPADFDHDMILSIDKDGNGSYDFYLVINIVFNEGSYNNYDTAGYIYQDNGNGTYDRAEETLITTFGSEEYEVSPSAASINGAVLQEVKMDIAEIFTRLDLEWGESIYVRYEAHSEAADQTDAAEFTFEEPDIQIVQKAHIDSWDAYRYTNNNGVSCADRLVLEIKGKHFDEDAKVEIGSQDAYSVKKKTSKKIVAKFCIDDLLDNQASRKRTITVTNPNADEERAEKKINLSNVDYENFSTDDFSADSTEGVLNIQRALISLDFLDEQYDTGFFGSLTAGAVKEFQRRHNISQTGYVGPLTKAKLAEELK